MFCPVGDHQAFPVLVLPAHDLGQPPVHDIDFAEITHHDVVRFKVAVDDPLGVGVGYSIAYFEKRVQGFGQPLRIIGGPFFGCALDHLG